MLLRGIYKINSLLPGGDLFKVKDSPTNSDRDIFNLISSTESTIQFTTKERVLGRLLIEELGIPQSAKFVTLCVRDSAYLDTIIPATDWSCHNYRDSNIDNYILAAGALADIGFFVVRVGAKVNKEFNTKHPRIIDYACNGKRTEFLDLYLAAKCEFCISTGTGFDALPYIFRQPIVFTNYVPVGYFFTFIKGLTITKHHYSEKLKRGLSIKEIIDHKLLFTLDSSMYSKHGIEFNENSPEEIRDVCLEMVEIVEGSHIISNEDRLLQKKFWNIFPLSELINGLPLHGKVGTRIG